jgi:hypothetical protein
MASKRGNDSGPRVPEKKAKDNAHAKLKIPNLSDVSPDDLSRCILPMIEEVQKQPYNIRHVKRAAKVTMKDNRPEIEWTNVTSGPVLLNMGCSYIRPEGTYDATNTTKQLYKPGDLNASKYSVYIVPPKKDSTDPLASVYRAGFDELKMFVQKHDQALVDTLCAKENIMTYRPGEDHPIINLLNQEKRARDYDPAAKAGEFLKMMHDPHPETTQSRVPSSSYHAKTKSMEVDGAMCSYVLEGIGFFRKVFKKESSAGGLMTKPNDLAAIEKSWPEAFRGKAFHVPLAEKKGTYDAPSPFTHVYGAFNITDSLLRTPEAFNEARGKHEQVPIRHLLGTYKGLLPASVGFKEGPFFCSSKRVCAPMYLENVALLIPWELFIAFTQQTRVVREGLRIGDGAVSSAFAFLLDEGHDMHDAAEPGEDDVPGAAGGANPAHVVGAEGGSGASGGEPDVDPAVLRQRSLYLSAFGCDTGEPGGDRSGSGGMLDTSPPASVELASGKGKSKAGG